MEASTFQRRDFATEHAFAVPDFNEVTNSLNIPCGLQNGFFDLNLNLNISDLAPLEVTQQFKETTKTADVSLFDIGNLPELPLLQDLTSNIGPDEALPPETLCPAPNLDAPQQYPDLDLLLEDVWQSPQTLQPLATETSLLTWESFAKQSRNTESRPGFISEAGPTAFDAALTIYVRESKKGVDAGNAVLQNVLLRSLWQLGLGREAILFPSVAGNCTFTQAVERPRGSGLSVACSQSLVKSFLQLGQSGKELRVFAGTVGLQEDELPCRIALASAIDTVLVTHERFLVENASDVGTLLHLKVSFEPFFKSTQIALNLMRATQKCNSDQEILDVVWGYLQSHEHVEEGLKNFLQQVLKYVAYPWLEQLEHRLGLSLHPTSVKASGEEVQGEEGLSGNQDSWPAFIPSGLQALISETKQCLSFIQEHQPDHFFVQNQRNLQSHHPRLSLEFTWDDIERVERKAQSYRTKVQAALDDPNPLGVTQSSTPTTEPTERSTDVSCTESYLELDIGKFASLPQIAETDHPSPIQISLRNYLNGPSSVAQDTTSTQPPPYLSLMPLISVQHSLLTPLILPTLLPPLLTHLHLHESFSLFASGTFTAQLITALFDPTPHTTERTKSHIRIPGPTGMGLNLNTRSTWPPASSEVQLALRSVLVDTSPDRSAGGVAFAIRTDLSEAEVERVLNAGSLHALDFLRLAYDTPPVLQVLFTDDVVKKYDGLFAFWLRMLRVRDALGRMWAVATSGGVRVRRLGWECMTFVNAVVGWMRSGVEGVWRGFLKEVDAVEEKGETLAGLVQLHRKALGRMSNICLLRSGQQKMQEALEDCMQCVLDFVGLLYYDNGETRVKDISRRFEEKRSLFLKTLEACSQDEKDEALSDLLEVVGWDWGS